MTPIPQGSQCVENLHAQFSESISASGIPKQSALRHVDVGEFVNELKSAGVSLFTGVPDSLLKNFCAYVTDNCDENHAIREGELDRGITVQNLHNIQIGRGRPELMYDLDVAAVLGSVTMATPRPSHMGRNDINGKIGLVLSSVASIVCFISCLQSVNRKVKIFGGSSSNGLVK